MKRKFICFAWPFRPGHGLFQAVLATLLNSQINSVTTTDCLSALWHPAGIALALPLFDIPTIYQCIGALMLSNLYVSQKRMSLVNNHNRSFEGTSRRAVSYFPGSGLSPKGKAKLEICNEQPILPQLLNIEASKVSGCIKMECKRVKSRAAALIYKGRVIACVYGCKSNPEQLFGREAYAAMMSEIGSVHTTVTSYVLDEKVVLSAASLFHGQLLSSTADQNPSLSLSACMKNIEKHAASGSIAVADCQGQAVCLLYLSGGALLGINSLDPIVKEKDIRSIWDYLNKRPQSKIIANSIESAEEAASALTFSMLGQSHKRPAAQSAASLCSVSELAALRNSVGAYSVKPIEAAQAVRSDRFISRRDLTTKQANFNRYSESSYGVSARR